jgi:sporulation-control protein spo0M
MPLLTRDQIAKTTLKAELVPVPEWGGEVYVRVMSGTESDAFLDLLYDHETAHGNTRLPHLKAVLACLTVCDAQGTRLFSLEDLELVCGLDSAALNRIFEVARRLNGLNPDSEEALTKNSESAPSSVSGTN